jgi:two-component system, chemotaxis family, sensor kinase CheA
VSSREREPRFLEAFRRESSDRLDRVAAKLDALAAGREDPDTPESLYREIHTIRGAAATLELDQVTALARGIEEVLDEVRGRPSFPLELIEPLRSAAEALRAQAAGRAAPSGEVLTALRLAAHG